jgi:hypothetical protein
VENRKGNTPVFLAFVEVRLEDKTVDAILFSLETYVILPFVFMSNLEM